MFLLILLKMRLIEKRNSSDFLQFYCHFRKFIDDKSCKTGSRGKKLLIRAKTAFEFCAVFCTPISLLSKFKRFYQFHFWRK
jgi:hypothetical protein